jgi:hypothetical protein
LIFSAFNPAASVCIRGKKPFFAENSLAIPPAAMAADPDRLKEARFFYTINSCAQRTNQLILSILSTLSVCVRVCPWQKIAL